jgi:hypothetical protein
MSIYDVIAQSSGMAQLPLWSESSRLLTGLIPKAADPVFQ